MRLVRADQHRACGLLGPRHQTAKLHAAFDVQAVGGLVEELGAVQGSAADIGGYYLPDTAKLDKVMRPSATLNAALAKLG